MGNHKEPTEENRKEIARKLIEQANEKDKIVSKKLKDALIKQHQEERLDRKAQQSDDAAIRIKICRKKELKKIKKIGTRLDHCRYALIETDKKIRDNRELIISLKMCKYNVYFVALE